MTEFHPQKVRIDGFLSPPAFRRLNANVLPANRETVRPAVAWRNHATRLANPAKRCSLRRGGPTDSVCNLWVIRRPRFEAFAKRDFGAALADAWARFGGTAIRASAGTTTGPAALAESARLKSFVDRKSAFPFAEGTVSLLGRPLHFRLERELRPAYFPVRAVAAIWLLRHRVERHDTQRFDYGPGAILGDNDDTGVPSDRFAIRDRKVRLFRRPYAVLVDPALLVV